MADRSLARRLTFALVAPAIALLSACGGGSDVEVRPESSASNSGLADQRLVSRANAMQKTILQGAITGAATGAGISALLDDDTIPDDDPRKEEAQDFVDAYDKVDVYEDGGGTREANEAKVADAEGIGDAGEAVTKAEEDALAHYKGDFDALSEEEQDDVRQALHDALPQDETEIHDALERYDEKSMSPDEGDEMDEEYSESEDGEMAPEGSESAMSEEIVPNDQS